MMNLIELLAFTSAAISVGLILGTHSGKVERLEKRIIKLNCMLEVMQKHLGIKVMVINETNDGLLIEVEQLPRFETVKSEEMN